MTSFSKLIFLTGIFLITLCQLQAQGRQVIIGLDESGSMYDSWDELNYALQTIIALIDENDDLAIVRANAQQTITVNTKSKQSEVAKWYNAPPSGDNGESRMISAASNIMSQNPNKEVLLILIGDGAWSSTGSACRALSNAFQKHKKRPRIIFFKIGSPAQSGFEADLANYSTMGVEKIFTQYGDETTLKSNLNKLANIIVEGKQGQVKVNRSGSNIDFQPIFPLKKVIVLIQNQNCSVSSVSSGFKLTGPVEMKNFGVNGNLSGRCYEIFANGKSIIPTTANISLTCSNGSCCNPSSRDFKIIPIVDMDLISEPEGDFIFSDHDKKEYHICEKATEVSVKAFLQDRKKNKIPLTGAGLSNLKIAASNGRNTSTLSLGASEATGKIQLAGTTTIVEVEATYDGYFQKKTAFTFIKKPCPLKLDIKVSGEIENADEGNQVYEVCPHVKTVDFKTFVKDDMGTKKVFSDFKSVDVYFKKDGKETALKKANDEFDGTLNLGINDTEVTLILKTNGSKVFETKKYHFKRVLCGTEQDPTELEIGKVPVMEFSSEGKCIQDIRILRSNGVEIDYNKYDFELTEVPFEFNVILDTSGPRPKLCLEKKPYLCDCFVRSGTFSGTITAIPNAPGLAEIRKKWTLTLVKEKSFWERCKFCFLIASILAGLIWYIIGIWTKPRFHKSAKFEAEEEDKTSMYAPPRKLPRKALYTSFFNRYFIPYVPESKKIDGIKFKASRNKNSIFLAKESISEKLSRNGEPLNPRTRRDVKIFKNNTIELERGQNKVVKYTLKVK